MTNKEYLKHLRVPTVEEPLRILFSSCLLGTLCGADGSSYGSYPHIITLAAYPNVKALHFCPEDFVFGTPREIPDISGGHGLDVLNGNATVINESGENITEAMITAAKKMLQVAQDNQVELAIMMDVSAACGSQVIYKGHRLSKDTSYQIGMGVCAALLSQNGFKVVAQRDFESLEMLLNKIDATHILNPQAVDYDQTAWYKEYFKDQLKG